MIGDEYMFIDLEKVLCWSIKHSKVSSYVGDASERIYESPKQCVCTCK